MASISSSTTSIPTSWLSETNSTSLRDASFSSYLNSSEETYIRNLVQTTQTQQHDPLYNSRPSKKVEDGEIDVFSADKYFNGEIVRSERDEARKRRNWQQVESDHEDKVVMSLSNLKLQPRTPSVHSESSWNSQSALLRPVRRTPSRSSTNSNSGNSLGKRSSFLSSCYCCDKNSVEVESNRELKIPQDRLYNNKGGLEEMYERGTSRATIKTSLDTAEITRLNKIRQQQQQETYLFTLRASEEKLTVTAMKKKLQLQEQEDEDKRRKSLDVFGSNDIDDDGSKRFSIENKLNMLTWNAIIPRSSSVEEAEEEETVVSGRPSDSYRDTESDASSDLFELECLSCTANPIRVAQPSEDGCATPTTAAYAPSEISVDWSVVTASAADFSMVSDSDEQRSVLTSVSRRRMSACPRKAPPINNKVGQSYKPRSGGMLAGCKSQKAVRVAGDKHRSAVTGVSGSNNKGKSGDSSAQRVHRFSDSFSPVTRFHAEAKLPGGYGLRPSKILSSTSNLLYIQ